MAKYGAGITNKQAKFLAALCRELRVPYVGRGLTRDEASVAIRELKERADAKRIAHQERMRNLV